MNYTNRTLMKGKWGRGVSRLFFFLNNVTDGYFFFSFAGYWTVNTRNFSVSYAESMLKGFAIP